MQFVFDERKAGQAAAYLLRRHGDPMESTRLVTLLYLADRQSLIDTGYTVTGDDLISIGTGPALANILELVTCSACDPATPWLRYVQPIGEDRVTCTASDGRGALSDYVTALLDGLCDTYGSLPEAKLCAVTAELPEWSEPGSGSEPIDPVTILRAAGYSDEDIEETSGLVASMYWLRSVLDR